MKTEHKIRRDRHVGDRRELLCTCGWRSENLAHEVKARFEAHTRFRGMIEVLPLSLRRRFSWIQTAIDRSKAAAAKTSAKMVDIRK